MEAAVYSPLGFEEEEEEEVRWIGVSATVVKGSRVILSKVSGECGPGSMRAIMGASGSGKTTLLNILASRGSTAGLKIEGVVSVRSTRTAFVEQEICCVATATPREAIEFAAAMRTNDPDRKEKVDRLLKMLRLEECADTMLGNDMLKGASGGERRRTAVAVELVTNPSVVFLDECTSGLDSYAAFIVVKLLRDTISGKTVLCTIHQPSSEVFHLFESVEFLRQGRLVYSGPTGDPLRERFGTCGFPVPPNTNLADHALFVFQTCREDEADKFVEAAAPPEGGQSRQTSLPSPRRGGTSSPMLLEIQLIGLREIRMMMRDPAEMGARVVMTSLLSVLVAVCFKDAGRSSEDFQSIQNHFGCVTQICIMGAMAISQPLILSFPAQRNVLIREYAARTYAMTSYVAAKLTLEIFTCLLQAAIILSINYSTMGLQGNFVHLWLAIALVALSTSSSVLVVSAVASKPEEAMQFAPLVLIPQMLFMGIFVRVTQIPTIVRWARWLCSLKYGINLIMIIEFKDCHSFACDQLLETNSVERDDARLYLGALVLIFALFRFLAVFVLRATAMRI